MIDQKSDKIEYKESNVQGNKSIKGNKLPSNHPIPTEQNQIPVVSLFIKYEQELMEQYLRSSLLNSSTNNEVPQSSK